MRGGREKGQGGRERGRDEEKEIGDREKLFTSLQCAVLSLAVHFPRGSRRAPVSLHLSLRQSASSLSTEASEAGSRRCASVRRPTVHRPTGRVASGFLTKRTIDFFSEAQNILTAKI